MRFLCANKYKLPVVCVTVQESIGFTQEVHQRGLLVSPATDRVTCFSCNGQGKLVKSETDVLKETVKALTLERDRALALIAEMLLQIGDKEPSIWERNFGILSDLHNDIYEREHPEVEVPW